MLAKALTGRTRYWAWIAFLLAVMGAGAACYVRQVTVGLGGTGMGRDVSWGLYIAQFTFLVGVAASAVVVVLPYYLHDFKAFGPITVLAEFLAVAAVAMGGMFIVADLGRPDRAFFMLLHPTPGSVMFWDMLILNSYLVMNILVAWVVLGAQRREVPPPRWVKLVIYLSIPTAISLPTAFLYAGLPGRALWLSAILAAKFLASSFSSGPALLILLCLIIKRLSRWDPGVQAVQFLARFLTYALLANLFFLLLEFFTTFYSRIPGHMQSLQYLYFGLEGGGNLVPWMRASVLLAVIAAILLIVPRARLNEGILAGACAAVFVSIWIEKGLGVVIGGFIPSPLGKIVEYSPTTPELFITCGVWAAGALILTVLYKIAIGVNEELIA